MWRGGDEDGAGMEVRSHPRRCYVIRSRYSIIRHVSAAETREGAQMNRGSGDAEVPSNRAFALRRGTPEEQKQTDDAVSKLSE